MSSSDSRGIPSRWRRPSAGRIETSLLDRERAEDGENGGEIVCRLSETFQTATDAADGATSGGEGDARRAIFGHGCGRFRASEG